MRAGRWEGSLVILAECRWATVAGEAGACTSPTPSRNRKRVVIHETVSLISMLHLVVTKLSVHRRRPLLAPGCFPPAKLVLGKSRVCHPTGRREETGPSAEVAKLSLSGRLTCW